MNKNIFFIIDSFYLDYLQYYINLPRLNIYIYCFNQDMLNKLKKYNIINELTTDIIINNNIDVLVINVKSTKDNINIVEQFIKDSNYKKIIHVFSNLKLANTNTNTNTNIIFKNTYQVEKIKEILFELKNSDNLSSIKHKECLININTKETNHSLIKSVVNSDKIPKSSKNSLIKESLREFIKICVSYIDLFKNLELPEIYKGCINETIYIENRILEHSECLIRNCIYKLGNNWSHTVVCGPESYDFYSKLCYIIHPNINVINIEINNLNRNTYNNLLLTKDFWNLFKGEKLLIYQSDSFIFKNNISDFLEYDYIGAPFNKNGSCILAKEQVGNGGLSLRSKSVMINTLDKITLTDEGYSKGIVYYSKIEKLDNLPEDIIFSQNIQNLHLGVVADYETGKKFSIDSVYYNDSFGMHCMWYCCSNWKNVLVSNIENIETYKSNCSPKSVNPPKYKHINISLNNNSDNQLTLYKPETNIKLLKVHSDIQKNANCFDFDLNFMRQGYDLSITTHTKLITYIKEHNFNNHFFHPKQLYNLFKDISVLKSKTNLLSVVYNKITYELPEFIKYADNLSYEEYKDICIKCVDNNNFMEGKLLLLVFIGNIEKLEYILEKIEHYSTIELEQFSLLFCLNYKISDVAITKIKNTFKTNYIIYISNEFGSDITPSLLVYDTIINKYNFEYVIKIHSKSDVTFLKNNVDFLLSNNLDELLKKQNSNSSTIGYNYLHKNKDVFNRNLINKYNELLVNTEFVNGTIFLTKSSTMNKVVDFLKNNYKTILYQNTYDNNTLNMKESYVHFMERLFGYF